jgi:hypothetical protein
MFNELVTFHAPFMMFNRARTDESWTGKDGGNEANHRQLLSV